MSQLALTTESVALSDFFENLASCRDKNPLTHGFHPYPAKFIPHIPRVLIRAYAPPGGVVLDPMCGSGTTLVEAAVSRHNAIGVDINPVAALVTRAKTTVLSRADEDEIAVLIASLQSAAALVEQEPRSLWDEINDQEFPTFLNRSKWFSDEVTRELVYAKRAIGQLDSDASKTLALCAFSAVLVSVSNQESETRWCAVSKKITPGDALGRMARKLGVYTARLRELGTVGATPALVFDSDARSLPICSKSVDLVVTSPPYANSHDYYLYNKLRLFWLGYEVRPVQLAEIGSRNRHSDMKEEIESYLSSMTCVLHETRRTLKEGGVAVFVVADAIIRGVAYQMDQFFEEIGQRAGFSLRDSFHFTHKNFNAAFQRTFGTHHPKRTHVLVFQ